MLKYYIRGVMYGHTYLIWTLDCVSSVLICLDVSTFDVLLTVPLSIFILVIMQLDAQNLFNNKFISCLYMLRAPCVHLQEVKIVLHSLWYRHTYRCNDTRGFVVTDDPGSKPDQKYARRRDAQNYLGRIK